MKKLMIKLAIVINLDVKKEEGVAIKYSLYSGHKSR